MLVQNSFPSQTLLVKFFCSQKLYFGVLLLSCPIYLYILLINSVQDIITYAILINRVLPGPTAFRRLCRVTGPNLLAPPKIKDVRASAAVLLFFFQISRF